MEQWEGVTSQDAEVMAADAVFFPLFLICVGPRSWDRARQVQDVSYLLGVKTPSSHTQRRISWVLLDPITSVMKINHPSLHRAGV